MKPDEDLRKFFEDFHQCCEEALANNVHLMDDIFTKILEQNQKIIEQNNQILSQCQHMKLQSSAVVNCLEKLKQFVLHRESTSQIEQAPVEDTPPTELRSDVELNNEVILQNSNSVCDGQEDAILDPTFETVYHLKDVPDENSEVPSMNNCQVNGETNNDKQKEKRYPDWLARNEYICHLMENQRKVEMLLEPLCGAGSSKNNPTDPKLAKLMANLKEVSSYLECFCVDPEEIEKSEDLKEKFAKLQLFMTETDAEMQKKNATCSSMASLANDSMVETDKQESEMSNDCKVVEKNAVPGSTVKYDDLNNNTNNSSRKKLTLKRKRDEVKVVEKRGGEKAQVVKEGDDEKVKPIINQKKIRKAQVQETRSRPFTRESRPFTASFQKRLRSGRELVIRTNNIPKRIICERGQVVKSLDDSIKSIGKVEQRKLNGRKRNCSASQKVLI